MRQLRQTRCAKRMYFNAKKAERYGGGSGPRDYPDELLIGQAIHVSLNALFIRTPVSSHSWDHTCSKCLALNRCKTSGPQAAGNSTGNSYSHLVTVPKSEK